MSNDNSAGFGLVLEHIESELAAIVEGQAALSGMPVRLTAIEDDLLIIKTDVKAIKSVMTGHSQQLDNHETRITQLESTT